MAYESLHVFPYKPESKSARALTMGLTADTPKKVKMVRHDPSKSKFRGRESKLVINWGWSRGDFPNPEVSKCTVLNPPDVISRVTNKLTFFEHCSTKTDGVECPRIPRWTTQKDEARMWIEGEGRVVFAREVLNGNSGVGIVEVTNVDDLDAIKEGTLLVEYIPKKIEFRIHVGFGEAFDVQRKGLAADRVEGPNWRVRNVKNGFVFVRNDLGDVPQDVFDQAILACNKVGLDFGAVDVVWNERRNSAYVLEINAAPGLEGTTLKNYSDFFRKKFSGITG